MDNVFRRIQAHKCIFQKNRKRIQVDKIRFEDNKEVWVMFVGDISVAINNCPFCGKELEISAAQFLDEERLEGQLDIEDYPGVMP